jgi:nucleotide-binding universal stress UspA family protein
MASGWRFPTLEERMKEAKLMDRDPGACLQTLVVGVDFLDAGSVALQEALQLSALRPGCEVHVVHVAEAGRLQTGGQIQRANAHLEELPRQLRAYVAGRWAGPQTPAGTLLRLHVRVGEPALAILQLAVDVDADQILVGIGNRPAIDRHLGSVAAILLRDAHCPVLLVRTKDYALLAHSPSIEPPCPDCLHLRRSSAGATWWCERHTRPLVAGRWSYGAAEP